MSLVANTFRKSTMRAALTMSGIFIVILALCGAWMVARINSEARAEIDAQLLAQFDELAAFEAEDLRLWFQSGDDGLIYFEALRTGDGAVLGPIRSDIFERPGFHTVSTEALFQRNVLTDAEQAVAYDSVLEESVATLGYRSWRVYVGVRGADRLAVFEPVGLVDDTLGIVPRIVATVTLAVVITTLLAGLVVARGQQARLDRLREGIARFGRGDLRQRLAPPAVRDDIDEIMVGIDAAAAELETSVSRLRLFSQNVAHELRTPLARLRAVLEDSPQVPAAALDRTDDMIRTLDAVYRIARLTRPADHDALTDVPLAEVADLVDDMFAPVASDNGQNLRVVTRDAATIRGDIQLITQLLSNLVENAIRYAGEDADITITVDGSALSVRDTGTGLDSDLAELKGAPGERTEMMDLGAGLGLALVRAIAHYHGAEVTLRSENGLHAQVAFPTA